MIAKNLIGLDISEACKLLQPWWILDGQIVANGKGHYTFVRAVKGCVEFYTTNNIIEAVYPENKNL